MQATTIRSVSTVDFTAACVQNAGIAANLTLPLPLAHLGGGLLILRRFSIVSVQNLAWEGWVFGKSTGATGNCDTERFLGKWTFAASDGSQMAGAGLYHYTKDGLIIPYQDAGGTGQLHLYLVNLSATAKNAGVTGGVVVIVAAELQSMG